jgi:hypothetical protein
MLSIRVAEEFGQPIIRGDGLLQLRMNIHRLSYERGQIPFELVFVASPLLIVDPEFINVGALP